jgi:hypothetical protein
VPHHDRPPKTIALALLSYVTERRVGCQAIKVHHTRHHVTDSRYWFAFTWPGIDALLGTEPPK